MSYSLRLASTSSMCASAHTFIPAHHLLEGQTEVGQLVGDRDRHGRRHGAGDQAVALEGAQRLGEHLLADPRQPARQLGVAHRSRLADVVLAGVAGHRCRVRPAPARPTCRRSGRAAGGWGTRPGTTSYSAFACARFWAAVIVGIDRSFLPSGGLRTSRCLLPIGELPRRSWSGTTARTQPHEERKP